MSESPKRVKAGDKVGPGTYKCVDCGLEFAINESDKDLRKCPTCACETYNCFPMTHIRTDIKTPEDARNPPKR
ncbi:MAG: zinc ribbon-containing protein [Methanomicrobiales archaeon]|jgi:predicted Zn-ribbon and HTH transcriptional regulator|nr:zinc ribbon-containing protein [Methanomicrobiales archaeon]